MLSIVIQAGGQSRRMGTDKALVPFQGQPLISRIITRILPIADEILITTNHPENYTFLSYPLVKDVFPGRGALGGVYTALSAAKQPLVALIACDMPFINSRLLEAQETEILSNNADLVIPRIEGGLEPFHAVYDRENCLPHILQSIKDDLWRVDSWFPKVKVHYFEEALILKYDPNKLSFWNVNTPQELEKAIKLAEKQPYL